MLQMLNGGRPLSREFGRLERIATELDLTDEQQVAWRVFALTFDECRDAIEAVDAIAEVKRDDRAPTLQDALEAQAPCLSVRLGAARQIKVAVDGLYRVLAPQQRRRADRLLTVVYRELSSVPERLSDRNCRRA